jgi:hypothetical protein
MDALGRMNAPVETSTSFAPQPGEGRVVSTTLAKCVGTATLGGDPITSYVYVIEMVRVVSIDTFRKCEAYD